MLYIEQNPLKAKMVKRLEEYPYSSYHYFLKKEIPECLQQAWIVQNHGNDYESIEAMLNSKVDTSQLDEMRKASSLIAAHNVDKKADIKKLEKMLLNNKDIKERNKQIVKAYKKGYSQHMVAKVLELNQATVQRIIKRTEV
jgi:DNA-directed RNA polymerase specialized sigma subunit